MSAIIKLEDGRSFHRNSITVELILQAIASQLAPPQRRLQLWLEDKSQRCNPFMDFDLRGLDEWDRDAFWGAALAVKDTIEEGVRPSLEHLLAMHRSIEAGEPPSALNDHEKVYLFHPDWAEDLDELWFKDEA